MDWMKSADGGRNQGNAEVRTEATLSTRIWLIGALSLGLAAGTAIGILAYELKATGASNEYLLQDRQEGTRHSDTERCLHLALHKQFQGWVDDAFHEYHAVNAATHSGQFRAACSNLSEMGLALQASVADSALRPVTKQFVRLQSAMRGKCEAALRISIEAIAGNT